MENKIRLSSNDAHFISLGNGRLSTAVTLYSIPQGNITIGKSESCDIQLQGPGVRDVHCSVTRKHHSQQDHLDDIVLHRIGNGRILVEGVDVDDECILQQGSMITIGESNCLRFNFPRKAELLKSNSCNINPAASSSSNTKVMDSSTEKYDEVLRKTLNTSYVNFAEYKSEKTLNNNDNVSEKMKNLKLKTNGNDSYPTRANMQVYPFASNSLLVSPQPLSLDSSSSASAKTLENVEEMQQLEQVLKMFVDYNNDNRGASNRSLTATSPTASSTTSTTSIHQNRIKTNGSLPKNFHTRDHANNFDFSDSELRSMTADDIEMYKKPQSPRTRIRTFVTSPTSKTAGCLSPTDNNDKSYDDNNKSKNSSMAESYEKDYEKLIKSFEEKFRMDIHSIQHNNGEQSSRASSEYLNAQSKADVLSKIRELKVLISDIQTQESESHLESDVEKSLVLAEMSTEKSNLEKLNEKLSALKKQMKQLEIERIRKQKQQEIKQIKMKNSIKDIEAEIKMTREHKKLPDDAQKQLDELEERLEVDKKVYEDFEFHFLEDEAEWASLFEEYHSNISLFTHQIQEKKNLIQQLEQTNLANENNAQDEQKNLETRLFNLKQKLENEREKLKNIDKVLSNKTEGSNQSLSQLDGSVNNSPKFDRNSNIMSKSFNENMFFNRNKIEISHIDFNCNVDDDDKNSRASSRPSSIVETPKLGRSISSSNQTNQQQNHNQNGQSANASPLIMPKFNTMLSSSTNNYNLLYKSLPYAKSIANGSPAPSTSTMPRDVVVQRSNSTKQKRPLTRYLPNFSLDFDLRRHIVTAGHQVQLCPHVILNAMSCRGYLNKVGAKPLFSMRANTRWFVFDREKQMFVYYSDKSEKKPRGGAYFNAITDVYFDHSAAMKNNRTFIVKTKSRMFTLQAPSQQACSIWIDVIITGAQGKILEYEQ